MSFCLKNIFFVTCILAFNASLFAQSGNYIALKQQTEILENRKKLTSDVDLYLDNAKKVLTKHYHSSPEYIMVINSLGEIKTYYPKSKEVDYRQFSELASERNLIYYFVNNLTDHLGLADEGFTLISNSFEGQYYITHWKSPSILKGIESVKMVFENGVPVYSEYKATNSKILRKIYYLNYQDFIQFRLPDKIVEINYLPTGDSIISRTAFSDVEIVSEPDSPYFNFKIPDDAKSINDKENQ
jgi:hypothetical protein